MIGMFALVGMQKCTDGYGLYCIMKTYVLWGFGRYSKNPREVHAKLMRGNGSLVLGISTAELNQCL